MYRFTQNTGIVIRLSDGASVPTNEPGNADCRAYTEWLKQGNTPEPYVPTPPWPSEAREEAFVNDPDRAILVERLRNATPAQIKTYITNNVTNLAQAREMLIKLALVVAILIRR